MTARPSTAATPDSSCSANHTLDPDVQQRVERLDKATCVEWGGIWDEGAHVRAETLPTDYSDRTIVQTPADARAAFEKYDDWFEHILETHEPQSDACVLLPCGATKPIGTSGIHAKKVAALKQADFVPRCDIVIISEPCTVVPHDRRLHRPPVNYEFPPEFTEQSVAPAVFERFTDNIARFINEIGYETYYPYLVAGHQEKFDVALQKAAVDPRVVRIPGASLGLESRNFSGDLFKSVDDIVAKLEFVRAFADLDDPSLVTQYPTAVRDFYQNRPAYQSA